MKKKNYFADIVIIGGGVSGVAAAVGARRIGAKVLLVERHSYLGGNATGGLVGPFSTTYFDNKKVIAGIVDDIIIRLQMSRATLGTQKCPYPPGTTFGTGGWITTFDHEILKFVLDDLVNEAKIEVLFGTQLTNVEVSESGEICLLTVVSKGGTLQIKGNLFIDATGDGDLAVLAGAKYEIGSANGDIQPATLMVDIANVEIEKIVQYAINYPEEFAWITFPEYSKDPNRVCVAGSGFVSHIRDAKKKGDLILGRNRITFFSGVQKNRMKLNATRVNYVEIDNNESITSAEFEARKQARSLLDFVQQYLPGCRNARICAMGDYIGIRESRRIMGEYVLTREDVLSGARFDDAIGCGAYPIDKHKSGEQGDEEILDDVWIELQDAYDFSYRCLLPLGIDNLLVAGRPISTTHDAMASTRLMVHCMVTGQAAGVAAGISTQTGKKPKDIDIKFLQKELKKQNVFIRSS